MLKHHKKLHRMLVAAMLTISVAIPAAQADDDDFNEGSYSRHAEENRGKPMQRVQTNAKFKAECSNCHIAYAPNLLPAESWRKIMMGLDKHFGSDASLTEAENKEITTFLVSHASNRGRSSTTSLRISETEWFKRKHDSHEIAPAVWKNPKVKSRSNCSACHPRAESGDFNEDDIRIPR